MIETTVVIPHAGATENLVAVLTQLQMQETPPVHIYIIDCSPDKSGLRIAEKFCFNNVPIKVEVRKGSIYENWNAGIELSQMEHPEANILIINDDILLPVNAIKLFEFSADMDTALCYVPKTPARDHYKDYVDTFFQARGGYDGTVETDWMSGFCFYLTKKCLDEVGLFDTRYKVWFGDNDYENRIKEKGKIKLLKALYIYHYGGKSYQYLSPEIQALIRQDRTLFYEKYPTPVV